MFDINLPNRPLKESKYEALIGRAMSVPLLPEKRVDVGGAATVPSSMPSQGGFDEDSPVEGQRLPSTSLKVRDEKPHDNNTTYPSRSASTGSASSIQVVSGTNEVGLDCRALVDTACEKAILPHLEVRISGVPVIFPAHEQGGLDLESL